jgi:hypothetical protein
MPYSSEGSCRFQQQRIRYIVFPPGPFLPEAGRSGSIAQGLLLGRDRGVKDPYLLLHLLLYCRDDSHLRRSWAAVSLTLCDAFCPHPGMKAETPALLPAITMMSYALHYRPHGRLILRRTAPGIRSIRFR